MALRDFFRSLAAPGAPAKRAGGSRMLRSPHAVLTPEQLIYADVFGDGDPFAGRVYSRAQALQVPAIQAARNRVIEHLAGRPLADWYGETRTKKQPSWMTRTDHPLAVSPWQRLRCTFDDQIFDGVSLWAVERDRREQIANALYVPFERWQMDDDGVVYFDGEEAPDDQVLVIPGPHGGILHEGRATIEGGLAIERAWRARARNPVPSVILREREDNSMTQAEAQKYVTAVAAARRDPDGGVMYVPYKVEATFEEHSGESFLEAARNAIRLDVAAYFNATAQGIEASKAQSTLTYETTAQAEAQTVNRMSFWSEPLEARLSLDDVVPRGHRTRLNFEDQHHPQTGTPTED